MTAPPQPAATPALRAAMILQYAVGGAYLPFATIYLRDKGLGYDQVGQILLTAAAVGTATPFLFGYLADRWVHVDRLLGLMHLGTAASLFLFSRQESFVALLVTLALVTALYQPTSYLLHALAYHNLPSPDRDFGRLRVRGSVGWMVPSLPIYLWLAFRPGPSSGDVRFVMHLATAAALAMACVTPLLPRTPPGARTERGEPSVHPGWRASLRRLVGRPGFIPLILAIFLVHSSFAVLFFYSPPYLEQAGFERRWIGPLQCIGVAVEVPFLFALPRVIRRLGYHGTITLGCVMLLLRQALYAAAAPPWVLASSYVFAGACVAFYLTAVSLALNSAADASVRATAQTIFALAGPGLGQMFGHEAVGWIASRAPGGLQTGFLFATATAGAALLLLALVQRRTGIFGPELKSTA
ncbi:MAG: MFS transporter [Planctomycetes bacterium]|nr:MFS transporter [Planctomycetota bacterium]